MRFRALLAQLAVSAVCLGVLPAVVAAQAPAAPAPQTPAPDHAEHVHAPVSETPPADGAEPTHQHPSPLSRAAPPLTEADRAAAFPVLEHAHHTVHDRAIFSYVLVDQLEWQRVGAVNGASWDAKGWVGGDIHRLWFHSEGEGDADRVDTAWGKVLYGRAITPWWDLVGGLRQDVRPGPARTWAAFGIQGLAPYLFEIEAIAYLGAGGRTLFRLEAEHELLVTNRLVLQPLLELDVYGKPDPARRLGAGLSSWDMGVRLRYAVRRELAPYVGVVWHRTFFGTADAARAAGERIGSTRLVAGVRTWF